MGRNPDFDITYDCLDYDSSGNYGKGILSLDVGIEGDLITIGVISSTLDLGNLIIEGDANFSPVTVASDLDLGNVILEGDFVVSLPVTNWVKWSNIGEFDFTIDRKNTAGEMPLDWRGTIWAILKLGIGVVVYGSGGVTQLLAHDNVFAPKTLSRVGLNNPWAVVGTDTFHVFIDSKDRLCQVNIKRSNVAEPSIVSMDILGYDEFLEDLTQPILQYDESNNLVYICDGNNGFVYNVQDQSFGEGPSKITGIGYSNYVDYAVASASEVTVPTMEIATDLIDIGTRNNKTLQEIEIGTESSEVIEACVEFSMGLASPLIQTPWVPIFPTGNGTLPCFGKEFRVRIRCLADTILELDYLRIKGVIHNYSPIDT